MLRGFFMTRVTIIVPCYNEEEMLPLFLKKAEELFKNDEKYTFDFVYVNDGSKDKTLDILREASKNSDRISYISLSKNFGQDAALAAGLKEASGDVAIPIDCDMQDPPELIFELLKKYEEGYDVVNPQRSKRETDTIFKKESAGLFYKFVNKIAGKEVIPPNVSMYRLISRKALDYLNSLPESDRVLRTEIPFVGLKTCNVQFERQPREAGKTKYNLLKLLDLAERTIVNATNRLLNLVVKIGVILSVIGGLGALACLICFGYFKSGINDPYATAAEVLRMTSALDCVEYATMFFLAALIVGLVAVILYVPCMYLKVMHTNTQHRPTYLIGEKFDSEQSVKNSKEEKAE